MAVQMRPDALAKSHRPFGRLFSATRASHVGTGNYGELIFAVSAESLADIATLVAATELHPETEVDRTGNLVAKPTVGRAEVSAIHSIRKWSPAAERGYSLDEADDWLIGSTSRMQVELLDVPKTGTMRGAAIDDIQKLAALGVQRPRWLHLRGDILRRASIESASMVPLTRQVAVDHVDPTTEKVELRETLFLLEASNAVRRVALEDKIARTPELIEAERGAPTPSPAQVGVESKAIVGVIDGGVAGPFANSSIHVVGRSGLLAPEHKSVTKMSHATQVASILALGSAFNSDILRQDEDCRIYDLDLLPSDEFREGYYSSLDDFLDEVRASVARAKARDGVRIFNLSYNLVRAPGGSPYSVAARGLDRIALDLDVIFVISAGNLGVLEERVEWPPDPRDALASLGSSAALDGMGAPAESIANVSVGAINPPGMALGIEGAPTRYTRRSTPIPSALKPDFAAIGGGSAATAAETSGLYALDSFGRLDAVKGTSFASPIAARYLATLDKAIAGEVPRDLIIAVATHHAEIPPAMRHASLDAVTPSLVGRGVLPSVARTLNGVSSRFTLVFSDVIPPGRRVEFPFRWPDSLTSPEGKCRGRIKLTLVAQPTLNYAHGMEMVRVNLDGALKQSAEDGRFLSQVQPTHQFFSGYRYANERNLATTLGKWFPVKSWERTMPRGVGRSGDWRLDIDYLTRAGESISESGIRFAAVLTVEDPTGEASVHEDMRASLTTIGVSLSDLRTAVDVGVSARV
ncbi:Subtilase family protein [Clavibacter michiganensis]|uniref:Subtilase family protein n=1 Tax=Clavibacter michiganensis TaxID=28447 RepID=A0A251Y9U9_9MICO|nr:Subtilase family protein [Clavibacter michiganensis]